MTEGSLYPSFVEIDYHSDYAPHKMTIPTKQWNSGGAFGDFETWSAGAIPADEMVEALVTLMLPFFRSSVSFDGFTVFTMADVDAPAIPRASKVLGLDGTSVGTAPYKATQATWSAKTTAGSLAKIIMLDVALSGSFERLTYSSLTPAAEAFLAEWFDDGNAWSARIDGKPDYFLQISYTMNEKLRREYHMT